MANCEVCDKEIFKYKCPACHIKYCSVNCFKSHKNDLCDSKSNTESTKPTFIEDRTPKRMIFETIDTVPAEKLENLRHSEELQHLLRNKNFRNFLQELNDAQNPWKAMKVAMTEPLFLEFADECLKIVDNIEKP